MVAINRPDWQPSTSVVLVTAYWHGCCLCKLCTTVHVSNSLSLSLLHTSGVPVPAVTSVVPVVGVVSVRLQGGLQVMVAVNRPDWCPGTCAVM